MDDTFKYCLKHFEQLYTLHGFKNGHYLPLVCALLLSKSKETYINLLNILSKLCNDRNLQFNPKLHHVDFERSMYNL